jgi:NAD(P)H-flavin reductase/ferredoxin
VWRKLFQRGPSDFALHVQPSGAEMRASSGETVLQAALKQGLPFPHNCRVGGCGECKCRLVSGKVKELTDKSYLLSAEELAQHYILACQSRPLSDVVVEVALRAAAEAHPVVSTQGRIVAMQPLTADIVHLQLELAEPIAYTAGQYAEIAVPPQAGAGAAAGTVRCYSFASAPDAACPNVVDFYIRMVPGGLFTQWLFTQAQPGAVLQVRGPQGQFGLQAGSEPMLCIAGGSGLAPIKAMLEQAIQSKQATRPLVILLGVRTQADLYGLEAIDQIRRQWSGRFRFEPVLSAEQAGSGWQGLRGNVADQLKPVLGERLNEYSAWLCGPPVMIDACIAIMREAGMPAQCIHQDKFLDASHLAAQPAA